MSLMPGFEQMLHKYRIRAIRIVKDDYGREDSIEYITDAIPISGQKSGASERIAAGLEAATEMYTFYSGPGLDERITEKRTLRVSNFDGSLVGDFNARSRVDYAGEHIEIEATRLNTA